MGFRLLPILLLLLFAAPAAAQGPALDCSAPGFTTDGKTREWNRKRTALFTVTQGEAGHRCEDQVVAIGEEQHLTCKFAYGPFDKDLKQEEVELWGLKGPCGPWERLASLRTTKDGARGELWGIPDDGGRIYYKFPLPLPRGAHPVQALVRGDLSRACGMIHVLEPDTRVVVFDIDGTLTTSDFELIKDLFDRILDGSYEPEVRPDAVAVARFWSERGYLPVYITGRPGSLKQDSVTWLKGLGFPPGPVIATWDINQVMPTIKGVGQFKVRVLEDLKTRGRVRIEAAYGNAMTDIFAYGQAGVAKNRTWITGPNRGAEGTGAVESYGEHLQALKAGDFPQVEPVRTRWCE